jgi:hypothetical protein
MSKAMHKEEPDYLSYLLRLWRTSAKKRSLPGEEGVVWRASLHSPQTGERIGFPNLRELFDFLQRQTGVAADPDRGDGGAGA